MLMNSSLTKPSGDRVLFEEGTEVMSLNDDLPLVSVLFPICLLAARE